MRFKRRSQATFLRVCDLDEHLRFVSALAFTPTGSQALTAAHDGRLNVWDFKDRVRIRTHEHESAIRAAAFTSDGRHVVVLCDDRTVHVWSLETGVESDSFPVLGRPIDPAHKGLGRRYPTCASFSPDGEHLLIGSHDRTVYLLPMRRGARSRRYTGHEMPVFGVGFSTNDGPLWSYGQDDPLRLWDRESRRELRRFGDRRRIWSAAMSSDGSVVAAAMNHGRIQMWNAGSGEALSRLAGGGWFAADFSRLRPHTNPMWLLSGSFQGELCLWDIATRKKIARVSAHDGMIEEISSSIDGRYVLTAGGRRHNVVCWEIPQLIADHAGW